MRVKLSVLRLALVAVLPLAAGSAQAVYREGHHARIVHRAPAHAPTQVYGHRRWIPIGPPHAEYRAQRRPARYGAYGSAGYSDAIVGYAPRPSVFGVSQVARPEIYAAPVERAYRTEVHHYRVAVQSTREVRQTRYVPVVHYRPVTTTVSVPVTSYRTIERVERVPTIVYPRVDPGCRCAY